MSGNKNKYVIDVLIRLHRLILVCVISLSTLVFSSLQAEEVSSNNEMAAIQDAVKLDNAACQQCHDGQQTHVVSDDRLYAEEGDTRDLTSIIPEKYAKAVHGNMQCVDCHTNITDLQAPHQKSEVRRIDCAGCHDEIWSTDQEKNNQQANSWLGLVEKNIKAYRKSFHARDNVDDPRYVNAACHDCHDTHFFNVPVDKTSPEYAQWRLDIPNLCGKCHEEQLDAYSVSVHGSEALDERNVESAVCIDCHTTHEITGTSLAAFKLLNPEECGNCHKENLSTYRDTYHGQASSLGYTYTAKCYDCHGSHEILKASDPDSTVHADNRLETCQECHDGKKRSLATAGFVSFGPHAHTGDFERYPQMWIASRLMLALLLGVFTFFWLHSGLWYYREWQDRKAGKRVQVVQIEALGIDTSMYVRRFPLGWRIAHLLFALVTMTLVLTGTTALYAHTAWAPAVANLFGGAHVVSLIHRLAATLFIGIFFIHFVYVMQNLLRNPTFKWFGPNSLIPNWKDFRDCWGMFKWFVGSGPKPLFDRWAYFEKFDYWAVFWGVSIIGMSGMMLAFPDVTATFLPGWVFNVATLVHGEEAFLAAVFLFTVHFFNNHFRPDKLPPPDIVMFTGSQSLAEFRRDHPAQYLRLVETGELRNYLVDAPSRPMILGSKVLGLLLIGVGFCLLLLVAIGFFTAT